MRMSKLEKHFVNGRGHSDKVARHAEEMVRFADPRPGMRYLDVGCGNGAAPIHLARTLGLEIAGVDVDPAQIRIAQADSSELESARFLALDATQLPFDDNAFDIVSTNMVTHHVPEWQSLLAEMVRVLKPDGYFLYTDLVCPGWIAAIGRAIVRRHAGFPTIRELEALRLREGLTPIHQSRSTTRYETVCRLAA